MGLTSSSSLSSSMDKPRALDTGFFSFAGHPAGASGAVCPGGGTVGTGDVIRRCECYSMRSLDRKCCRHSLTFGAGGDHVHHHHFWPDLHDHLDQQQLRLKKKRTYGFATFKKKLIGKRRNGKGGSGNGGNNHAKYFREHFADCPSEVLKPLLSQYEALTLLKDLYVQANLARPPALTLGQSMTELFRSGSCADLDLVHHGQRYRVHRCVLVARCPYFGRHLPPAAPPPSEFCMDTFCSGPAASSVLTPVTMNRILAYLYSGKVKSLTGGADVVRNLPDSDCSDELQVFRMLEKEFGVPNGLESDMAYLLETGTSADCKLVFDLHPGCEPKAEPALGQILCHRAVLAARSGFFRRLIERKSRSNSEETSMEIWLDGEVLPAKYGKVLLHVMYTDTLDTRLIQHSQDGPHWLLHSSSALSAARESFFDGDLQAGGDRGHGCCSLILDLMNLYEMGRFLEFGFLSQICEDALMQLMVADNAVHILNWGLKPHGSAWVARQAMQYMEEEFCSLANSVGFLENLEAGALADLLKSDFTQASEAELLNATIKWGELQLRRKSKESQPNTVQQLSSSISGNCGSTLSRKVPKYREICDGELRELLSDFLVHIRVPHVLPRDRSSNILDVAIGRNLFPTHPNFACQGTVESKFSPWDPRNVSNAYARPRLFPPYFEECKKIIKDRCVQDPEIIASSSPRMMTMMGVPDTLYMVQGHQPQHPHHQHRNSQYLVAGTETSAQTAVESFNAEARLPDQEMVVKMVERLELLLNCVPVQKALHLVAAATAATPFSNVAATFSDGREVVRLVELRVVREFNLPDNYTTFLHKMRSRLAAGAAGRADLHGPTCGGRATTSSLNQVGFHHSGFHDDQVCQNSMMLEECNPGAGKGFDQLHHQGPDVTLDTNQQQPRSMPSYFASRADLDDDLIQRRSSGRHFLTRLAVRSGSRGRQEPEELSSSPDLVSSEPPGAACPAPTRSDQAVSNWWSTSFFVRNPPSPKARTLAALSSSTSCLLLGNNRGREGTVAPKENHQGEAHFKKAVFNVKKSCSGLVQLPKNRDGGIDDIDHMSMAFDPLSLTPPLSVHPSRDSRRIPSSFYPQAHSYHIHDFEATQWPPPAPI